MLLILLGVAIGCVSGGFLGKEVPPGLTKLALYVVAVGLSTWTTVMVGLAFS
jgi:hypothetical protein